MGRRATDSMIRDFTAGNSTYTLFLYIRESVLEAARPRGVARAVDVCGLAQQERMCVRSRRGAWICWAANVTRAHGESGCAKLMPPPIQAERERMRMDDRTNNSHIKMLVEKSPFPFTFTNRRKLL